MTSSLIIKIRRLIVDVPECKNKNYKREQVNADVRKKILETDECFLCTRKRRRNFVVHHVQPDGPSTKENLALLCYTCNQWVHHILHKLRGYRSVPRYFH